MIRKLRNKIIWVCLVSVVVVFLMGMAVLLGLGYSRLNDERMTRLTSELNKNQWEELDQVSSSAVAGIVLVNYDMQTDAIVNDVVGTGVSLSQKDVAQLSEKIGSRHLNSGRIGFRVLYAKRAEGDVVHIAIYDRRYTSVKDIKFAIYCFVALLVGATLYCFISYWLARLALRPVEKIWTRQKQFVADASHELKTPLSVIMANTELIASHGEETVNSQMRWLDNTRFEAERMTTLVNQLLFLAKNDDGLETTMETANFSECCESVVLSQEVLFYEKNKKFSYSIAPDLKVLGNDGQLKQLVTILLDNAIRYSEGEGNVQLNVTQTVNIYGKFAELTVSNDCAPITEEQMEHIFDRFYTVDTSRNKNNAGNGLGLAIAQTICENHQGTITAQYANGRISFVATIPLIKPQLIKSK